MPQVAEKTMDLYTAVGAFDWTEEPNSGPASTTFSLFEDDVLLMVSRGQGKEEQCVT